MLVQQEASVFVESATKACVQWVEEVQQEAASPFDAARRIATRLGAHWEDGRATFAFWFPERIEHDIPLDRIVLELFTPLEPIDFQAEHQTVRFRREHQPVLAAGETVWSVVEGVRPGTREEPGTFYWLRWQDDEDEWHTLRDPLAYSVPFGAFAPAELYDFEAVQAARSDRDYFQELDVATMQDGLPRLAGPSNLLQIHVNTASADGTLAGLTRIYETIAAKVQAGDPLTPAEQNYIGYDGVQLMPIEPTIEYESGPGFWRLPDETAASEEITAELFRPDMTNWGYDIITVASPAPNPTALASKRPDELVDFIATLHNFPGKPIKVVFDVVYGHADNQSLPLLNEKFIASPGMYGQNLDYRQPYVRALLLEMQRRKSNYGVDGLRVDGAQDFKYWDAEAQVLRHDDDYLRLMNDMVQEVAGQRYLPWMIFEDGRPWPRDDWELASTYREVTKQMPNVVQWGPLTFAHNTPFLFTFWISKWWRIREIAEVGSHWITGCANHDTLRRGTQVDPAARINTYLGENLPQIFKKAYDNPAAKLFDYAFMPGIPMDFINAAMHAPWSFIRNTDDRYSVKVVSEEAYFLDWVVDEEHFGRAENFKRLKALGFRDLPELRRFLRALDHTVKTTDYDLEAMVTLLNAVEPSLPGPELSVMRLKGIARAWMDDVHDYCNVTHWQDAVEGEQTQYNLDVREFRRQRPYLRQNLGPQDWLRYQHPTNGAVLFYGLRHAPDNGEQLLFLANMEGEPRTVTPLELADELPSDGWRVALATPGLAVTAVDQPVTLRDSEGVVFTRE